MAARSCSAVDPEATPAGADMIVTDTWVSMNQEHRARGHNIFQPYQVNAALMARADKGCALHALPAGASRRGGDRRGDRRSPVRRLRRGGKPPACARNPFWPGASASSELSLKRARAITI
ncbi:hypothetical protein [Thauera sp. SDU_THAU2]|uniref:hypothetical protein n=1 Tax=Thauera sp. SDU_THAU2 TaxID=3136633 RepID=UPI0040550720